MKDMFIGDPVGLVCLWRDMHGPVSSREAA